MSTIRTSIWNYFRASSVAPLYVDLGGARFHYSEAPEQIAYPYCVFNIFDEVRDSTFDLEFEDVSVQLDYYSDESSPDECDDGIADIKTMFDYANLTIVGYTCLQLVRAFVFDPVKIQPDNAWQGIVRYDLLIQKN